MAIDILYLLFLQSLRIMLGGTLDEFFNALSKFAVTILPILPYVMFWSVDKKWGYRYVTTLWSGEVINGIIKLTVCAYRPWIRDERIEPAGDSKVAATGYSFPSGHTMVSTAMYGTTAVKYKNESRGIFGAMIFLILLTGFSRNFLGVHTPQDVLCGLLESLFLIWIIGKAFAKFDGNDKAIDVFTIAGILFVILTLLYITMKPYPMDYVAGKLLVDPKVMMNDSFSACGGFTGLLLGSWIERKKIHYVIPHGSRKLPLLTCVGSAIAFAWLELFAPATVVLAFGPHWGRFVARLILVVFALVLYPLVIRKACAKEATTASFLQAPEAEKVSVR